MENYKDLRLPIHFEEFDGGEIMSNFDHSIDNDVAERIKGKDLFARYSGWNFNGKVWWDEAISKWCCEVHIYGSLSTVVVEDELREVMDEVCIGYGSE